MFRVCELRKHQLVEAHVRCYAIHHDLDTDEVFQSHLIRLQQPDDDLGSMLLMALPQVVVHRIDPWSPFYPTFATGGGDASTRPLFPDPVQRTVDAENGNRESSSSTYSCPTADDISKHVKETELEIIVVLEGIDGPTSATMQARHSYNMDDIRWNSNFVKCVERNVLDGGAVIDFDKFHLVQDDINRKEEV